MFCDGSKCDVHMTGDDPVFTEREQDYCGKCHAQLGLKARKTTASVRLQEYDIAKEEEEERLRAQWAEADKKLTNAVFTASKKLGKKSSVQFQQVYALQKQEIPEAEQERLGLPGCPELVVQAVPRKSSEAVETSIAQAALLVFGETKDAESEEDEEGSFKAANPHGV